jgi:octaprenyl-diphosphate synthase
VEVSILKAARAAAVPLQAGSLAACFEAIRPRLELVERFIADQLAAGPDAVREAGGYVLAAGGKRLRPAMLLVVSRLLGYEGERDVPYAAIIEMIHTATLVHDDIIDSAAVRRGHATANHRWGNQLTVLLGDWLYIRAMELALEAGDVAALRALSRATEQMTEGEIMGLAAQANPELSQQEYLEITRRKTAELFATACALPTFFAPALAQHRGAFEAYGRNIGMCFQIVDDILDVTASEERLGKPVFSDLREGRLTLPFILALPHLGERERLAVVDTLRTGEFRGVSPPELRQLLGQHGAVEAARTVASEFGERAVAALADAPAGPELEVLRRAPRLVLERDF